MKKILFSFLATIVSLSPVAAETLSANQALQRALGVSSIPFRAQGLKSNSYDLVYSGATLRDSEGAALYVFNRPDSDGFIIASGDTRMRPILAISDSGTFQAENMPENLRAWLQTYEYEAATLSNLPSEEYAEQSADRDPITPIVKTTWNQLSPYNSACPTYNGTTCPTGCVATAMAQIINALGYAKGQGSNSYTVNQIGGKTVSFNFGSWTPNFSNLIDSYSGSYTTAQVNEVAQLMLACGVAVNTGYGTSSSGASDPISGLVKYLGYDTSSRTIEREGMQTLQWEDMIYSLLSSGLPLYYTGTGSGGHAFVCDGYSDGLFHFNWGWGGLSDGYYALSALDPRNQGTGSADGGYNMTQSISIFATPQSPVDYFPGERIVKLVYGQAFTLPTTSGTQDKFSLMHTILTAPNGENTAMVGLSLMLRRADGSMDDIYITPVNFTKEQIRGVYWNYSVDWSKANVPAGEYLAYPAYSVKDYDGYWLIKPYGITTSIDHYDLTIGADGSRKYVLRQSVNPGIEILDFDTNGIYTSESNNKIYFKLKNNGPDDFIEQISARIFDSTGFETTLSTHYLVLPAGDSASFEVPVKISAPGVYTLSFHRDQFGGIVLTNDKFEITITKGKRPADGLLEIEAATDVPAEIYDLQGRRVTNPIRGIYITNGRKLLIK